MRTSLFSFIFLVSLGAQAQEYVNPNVPELQDYPSWNATITLADGSSGKGWLYETTDSTISILVKTDNKLKYEVITVHKDSVASIQITRKGLSIKNAKIGAKIGGGVLLGISIGVGAVVSAFAGPFALPALIIGTLPYTMVGVSLGGTIGSLMPENTFYRLESPGDFKAIANQISPKTLKKQLNLLP